jgi:hypothetical protein
METKGVQLKESIIAHEASKMKDELGFICKKQFEI